MNRRGFILGGCAALAGGMKALAAPTRSAVAARHIMGGGADAKLPYDAEVEYIGRTGAGNVLGPYIDTGIVPTEDTAIECDIAMDATSFFCVVIGSETSDGSNDKWHLRGQGANWKFTGAIGNKSTDGNSGSLPSITSGSRVSVKQNREYFSYENATLTLNYTGVLSATYPLFMFDGNLGGNAWKRAFIGKIYSMRIYDYSTNENLRDFIPVRFTNEQSQSEGAMYDRVSGALFRNAGTGAFTIGPDKN